MIEEANKESIFAGEIPQKNICNVFLGDNDLYLFFNSDIMGLLRKLSNELTEGFENNEYEYSETIHLDMESYENSIIRMLIPESDYGQAFISAFGKALQNKIFKDLMISVRKITGSKEAYLLLNTDSCCGAFIVLPDIFKINKKCMNLGFDFASGLNVSEVYGRAIAKNSLHPMLKNVKKRV